MKTKSSEHLYLNMKEGKVYRREELCVYSKAVDRDLKTLATEGKVVVMGAGLYYRPKMTRFGATPPEQHELVKAFLKTDDFLLFSTNVYNSLGLGLTQLSNEVTVYNRKRVGKFRLGANVYNFKRPINFPNKPTELFFLIDALNNISKLPAVPINFVEMALLRLRDFPRQKIQKIAKLYAKAGTLKLLRGTEANETKAIFA